MIKNILVLAKRFSIDRRNLWLIDELVDELVAQGYKVTVFYLDAKGINQTGVYKVGEMLTVYCFSVNTDLKNRYLRRLKQILAVFNAGLFFRKIIKNEGDKFNLIFSFSVFSAFPWIVKKAKIVNPSAKSIGVLWDFFPIHQSEIGVINSKILEKALYLLEKAQIASLDYIGLMSEKNIEFFKKYHPQNLPGKILFQLPVWGGENYKIVVPAKQVMKHLDKHKTNIVFGGQISKGRGIPLIVKLAKILDKSRYNLVLIGGGDLRQWLECEIEKHGLPIYLLEGLERREYLGLLSQCQLGLVVTVPNVSIPSFPSKIIDYLRLGLPVVAAVESTTDFGIYINYSIGCGKACDANDVNTLAENIHALSADKALYESCSRAGKEYFQKNMTSKAAVQKILNCINDH